MIKRIKQSLMGKKNETTLNPCEDLNIDLGELKGKGAELKVKAIHHYRLGIKFIEKGDSKRGYRNIGLAKGFIKDAEREEEKEKKILEKMTEKECVV